ncbi:protein of unknown function (plasmid) [Caballeronia sp. S22]
MSEKYLCKVLSANVGMICVSRANPNF